VLVESEWFLEPRVEGQLRKTVGGFPTNTLVTYAAINTVVT
jgi:hypothetical protein